MSIRLHLRLLVLASASALLISCAAKGPFPSLEPRAVEAELANEAEPVPHAPPPSDPAISARVAALTGQARAGDAAFETAIEAAEVAVAKAGPARSESWVQAEQALSRAEAARAPTTGALADLVAIAFTNASGPANPADHGAIDAAIAEVQAIVDRQSDRLNGLKGSLSAP